LIAAAVGKPDQQVPNGRTIMLTSALPGEGKTFTSINLALSMALEKDLEVLLVDADVAKPHISRIFGLEQEKGLLDLLADSSIQPESLIVDTDVPGLALLSAGTRTSNATELLASSRMDEAIGMLMYGHPRRVILLDSPPLMLSSEARALVPHAGQIALVVRAETTAQKAVLDAIEAIDEGSRVSLILNQSSLPPSGGYYGYGSYGDELPPPKA
jgi:exopolysaccharide/PEP-CTERM locus tyrosine autokinase